MSAVEIETSSRPSDQERSVFVTLADAHYVEQAKQLFSSLYFNAGWPGDYLLLAHDIVEDDLEWFEKRGIIVERCEPLYSGKLGGMPAVLTSKLYLFRREIRHWRNVVYCDADATVRASLDGLCELQGFWSITDASRWLDTQILTRASSAKRGLSTARFSRLEQELRGRVDFLAPPFCAGFFVFSTDVVDDGTFDRLKTTLDRYHSISRYGDQLAFNLFFGERWQRLSPVYNVQLRGEHNQWRLPPSEVDGIILHFISSEKPWLTRNAFFREWCDNLSRANEIDLSSRPPGVVWSPERLARTTRVLEERDRKQSRIRRHLLHRLHIRRPSVMRFVMRPRFRARRALQSGVQNLRRISLPLPAWGLRTRRSAPEVSEVAGREGEAPDMPASTRRDLNRRGRISPTRHYLICTTPRTGSSLLSSLLENTQVAGMQPDRVQGHEALRGIAVHWSAASEPTDEALRLQAEIDGAFAQSVTSNGVAGFKVMWSQVRRLAARGDHANAVGLDQFHQCVPEDTRYVWLRRRDHLRQAVSLMKAQQSQCWDSHAQQGFTGRYVFDYIRLRKNLRKLQRHDTAWQHYFNHHAITPTQVFYEDFVSHCADTVERVLRELDIPVHEGLVVHNKYFRRQADVVNDEWVQRYERVASLSPRQWKWSVLSAYPPWALAGILRVWRGWRLTRSINPTIY